MNNERTLRVFLFISVCVSCTLVSMSIPEGIMNTDYYDEEVEWSRGKKRVEVDYKGLKIDCEVEFILSVFMSAEMNFYHNVHVEDVKILEALAGGKDLKLTIDEWNELIELCFWEVACAEEERHKTDLAMINNVLNE